MPKTPLTVRMKSGELYIVLTSIDTYPFAYHCLCYGDGTPRIYSKERIDPRVWSQSPVCTTLKSAIKYLDRGEMAALIPLSLLVDAAQMRRWASDQRDVESETVIQYANAISPAPDVADVQDTIIEFVDRQKWWIDENPDATIGDLLAHFESIQAEFDCFDELATIAEVFGDLSCAAQEYVSLWGDFTEPDGADDTVTFLDRMGDLDDDLMALTELIDALGADYSVEELIESTSELAIAS